MAAVLVLNDRNPVVTFAEKGLTAAAKVVDGADVTSKATKFLKAVITVTGAIFANIAEGWHNLAGRLGGFADITDFMMIIVSVKDLFEIATGAIRGWMKQAAHSCLAAFRILWTLQFLDKLKLIKLGSLLNKVGCVPVFGTVTSAFVVTALTFFAIETGKKITSAEEATKAAHAKLAAAEWDLIQEHFKQRNHVPLGIPAIPADTIARVNAAYTQAFTARYPDALPAYVAARLVQVVNAPCFNVLVLPAHIGAVSDRIHRFAVYAKETADLKVSERRSLWIDLADKIVKISLIILISVGIITSVAFFAMTGPFMIGLAAFSATLSLTKVAFDKVFKNEPRLKDPSAIEQAYLDVVNAGALQGYHVARP